MDLNRLFYLFQEGPYTLKLFAYGLSTFYFGGLRLHQFLYKSGLLSQKKLPSKIISIGNLSVGGSGKTPFVIFLAKFFKSMGEKVIVVTRGYKSQSKSFIVSDGNKIYLTAKQAGDESYLLASNLKGIPVLKGKNRYKAIKLAYKYFSPKIVILDDAFQHYALKRDIDIVLLNAKNPFGNGYLLPRGILREPISALKRAHAVIITKVRHEREIKKFRNFLKKNFSHLAIFDAFSYINKIFNLKGESFSPFMLYNKPCLIFCGLANPKNFYETCKELNIKIIKFFSYPDHYFYTEKDIKNLIKMAKIFGAEALVTTEKDAVKLKSFNFDYPLYYLQLEIKLYQEEAFKKWIIKKLAF
ncbi:MAG: tetraacyldisaccharide 4'-kinase [Candidatus Desulfofervidus auxilii]|nr:tetraacyldisaccharide 4'-kinase [Candidatus Desulfofervidus auxilii]